MCVFCEDRIFHRIFHIFPDFLKIILEKLTILVSDILFSRRMHGWCLVSLVLSDMVCQSLVWQQDMVEYMNF